MRASGQTLVRIVVVGVLGVFLFAVTMTEPVTLRRVEAQVTPVSTPTPAPAVFDQKAAVAKLREQIKGRENELAPAVFKNIQTMKNTPAGRLLSVMEMGFARSLGVDCTHCHVPDRWESEEKTQKQTARDMSAMVTRINKELLPGIKNLKTDSAIVNCTTCHRGEIKPALNLPIR